MKAPLLTTAVCFLALGLLAVAGCGDGKTESKTTSPHDHGDEDKLHWEDEASHEGFKISLGWHGEHIHAGEKLEPAVMIANADGSSVADADVFTSLLAEDQTKVIGKEIKAVYEPKTSSEVAHYAYHDLPLHDVPAGATKAFIRYRIKLSGIDEEFTDDIEIKPHADED